MSVESTAKKVTGSRLTWFLVGVLAGGTVLAYPVAKAVGWIKSKLSRAA